LIIFCLLTWLVNWRLERGRRQVMLRQLFILFASVAAALSLANLGGGGGP
jgi:hypothetical protein